MRDYHVTRERLFEGGRTGEKVGDGRGINADYTADYGTDSLVGFSH